MSIPANPFKKSLKSLEKSKDGDVIHVTPADKQAKSGIFNRSQEDVQHLMSFEKSRYPSESLMAPYRLGLDSTGGSVVANYAIAQQLIALASELASDETDAGIFDFLKRDPAKKVEKREQKRHQEATEREIIEKHQSAKLTPEGIDKVVDLVNSMDGTFKELKKHGSDLKQNYDAIEYLVQDLLKKTKAGKQLFYTSDISRLMSINNKLNKINQDIQKLNSLSITEDNSPYTMLNTILKGVDRWKSDTVEEMGDEDIIQEESSSQSREEESPSQGRETVPARPSNKRNDTIVDKSPSTEDSLPPMPPEGEPVSDTPTTAPKKTAPDSSQVSAPKKKGPPPIPKNNPGSILIDPNEEGANIWKSLMGQ